MLLDDEEPTDVRPLPSEAVSSPTTPFLVLLASDVSRLRSAYALSRDVPTRLGRAPEMDVQLTDEGVSREHARISFENGEWHICDRGSKNGTHVNGKPAGEDPLNEGDRVEIGATAFVFTYLGQTRRGAGDTHALADVGTWEWKPGSDRVQWCDGIDAMLQLVPGALSRHTQLKPLVVSPAPEALDAEIARVRAASLPLELLVALVTPAGEMRWLTLRGRVSHRALREDVVSGNVTDVTALKQRDDDLRQRAMLFESFSDGVALLDLAGRIIDWNASAARLSGVSREEALAQAPLALLKTSQSYDAVMLSTLEERGRFHAEDAIRDQNGAPFFCELDAMPMKGTNGAVLGYVLLLRDIRERKLLQEKLVMSDRMAALGTLAAGVAHEINNPLAFVGANLEYLADNLEPGHAPEDAIEVMRETMVGIDRIAKIVSDLRALSRNDRVEKSAPVQLDDAIASACTMAAHLIRERAQLVKTLSPTRPVMGSASKLGQVVLNLLVNAAQAVDAGDPSRNQIRIALREEGADAVLEVTDTGPGVPAEVQARIFDPFFTTKPLGVGTGLGLSISRGIVAAYGGSLALRSPPGEGATFIVRLPLVDAVRDETVLQSGAPAAAPKRQARMLIVDDEPALGAALKRSLKNHDVTCVTAADQALVLLRSSHADVDLVLCDLMMPGMSGDQLFAAVQAELPDVARRFVFMTGGAYTEQVERFVASEPGTILRKPLDLAQLRELIDQIVNSRDRRASQTSERKKNPGWLAAFDST